MSDNNNPRAASLPQVPNPALKKLQRLLGTWRVSGSFATGQVRFEEMEGGFFILQHVELIAGGRHIKGVEYVGFDEDTQTLRSHFMDNHGSNFTYTWDVDGDIVWIWFGDKGTDNFFRGIFDETGNTYSGRWQWPTGNGTTGGYEAVANRVTPPSLL